MKALRWFLLLLGLASGPGARAQHEFDTWCMGWDFRTRATEAQGIKVKFLRGTPLPADTCAWFRPNENTPGVGGAGGSSVCDNATGDLLFFSDGFQIRNKLHSLMQNGILIERSAVVNDGDWIPYASPQTVAIVPTAPPLYHVFYWSGVRDAENNWLYLLKYAVVDMRLQGGLGAVVRKSAVLTRTANPRLTAVRHANNRDFWLLTRDEDSRGFQAFRLGPQGLDTVAVRSLAGQAQYPSWAMLKAAPNGRRLVCGTLAGVGTANVLGGLTVYDFDNATGQVSNEQTIRQVPVPNFGTTAAGRPRGLYTPYFQSSFSPNSRVLYNIELQNTGSQRSTDLYQYDLSQLANVAGLSRYWVSGITPTPTRYGEGILLSDLQLAPGGALWSQTAIRRDWIDPATNLFGPSAAAIIQRPDIVGSGCDYVAEAYPYRRGQKGANQLPNLITNMLYAPPVLNYEVGCDGDSVHFWASSAGAVAGLRWDFGELQSGASNVGQGQFVAHRYARGGRYPVRLTLAGGRVLTQTVEVNAFGADFTQANVFTPNNDGLNDTFRPVLGTLPMARLRVFSRWGSLVYETSAFAPAWDGAGAAAGEYFYHLEYANCRGAMRQQRGIVTLIR